MKKRIQIIIIILIISDSIFAFRANDNNFVLNGDIISNSGRTIDSSTILYGMITGKPDITSFNDKYYLKNHFYNSPSAMNNYKKIAPLDTLELLSDSIEISFQFPFNYNYGTIAYRIPGDENYYTASLKKKNNKLFTFQIPTDILTINGLQYYLTFGSQFHKTNFGNSKKPLRYLSKFPESLGKYPNTLIEKKYHLIGFPFKISGDNSVDTILNKSFGVYNPTQWRFGRYRTSVNRVLEYPITNEISTGKGYWLISRTTTEFSAEGLTTQPNRLIEGICYFEIPLDSGWNQLANPFGFSVNTDHFLIENNKVLENFIDSKDIENKTYTYHNSYFNNENIIHPWEGFFVYSMNYGLKLLVPEKKHNPLSKISDVNNIQNGIYNIILKNNNLIDKISFGFNDDALVKYDRHDLHKPPAPNGNPSVYFKISDNNEKFICDFRPPLVDGYTYELNFNLTEQAELSFVGFDELLSESLQCIIDFNQNQIIVIVSDTTIIIQSEIKSAKLIIGNKDFIENTTSSLPTSFELWQNYPNPFNLETKISFFIPYDSQIKLEIINLLGQKVKTLIDKRYKAGKYIESWDGTNDNKKEVASGIYFYRLTTSSIKISKKMMLLK